MTPLRAGGAATVSVIIPAYNAADFLTRAVESALAQTLAPHEILLVDDASTDGTFAVAEALAARHGAVRALSLPVNGGPAMARNAGLDAATGEYAAVLDADDAYAPDHLATLVQAAEVLAADVVLANFVYYDPVADKAGAPGIADEGVARLVGVTEYVDHCRPLRADSDWGLLKPLFRMAFLNAAALRYPANSRHGEDFLLMASALLQGARVALSPAITYRYTHRGVGWSRTRIDYAEAISATRSLASEPRAQAIPGLKAALDRRCDALTRWAAGTQVSWMLDRHLYFRLARHALRDSAIRREALRQLPARLGFASRSR